MIDSGTKVGIPVASPRGGGRWCRWLVLLALVTLGGGGVAWWLRPAPVAPGDDELDLDESLRVTNPGYVGARACGECHGPRLEVFQATRHFRACWSPEASQM